MTIAWKEKLKLKIQEGEEEESFDEDDLDVTKGLVYNEDYIKNRMYASQRWPWMNEKIYMVVKTI